jgi:23S rRNA pseudouridine1911/1915/1917 synthase
LENYRNFFEVVYEDNHLIIVNKKNGVLVQGDKTGDIPLSEHVKIYLRDKYQKPGNVFAGVVHRIDRPVSGLVILAKTSKALERMNEAFQEKAIQKTYWALTGDRPKEPEATLIHWLVKDTLKNVTKAHSKEGKGGQKSELSYSILAERQNLSLLEVKPVTGRPHQIRSQLAAIGCPIVGDVKYGYPRINQDASICLHARKLEFIHPVKKEPLIVYAGLPDNPKWKHFNDFKKD